MAKILKFIGIVIAAYLAICVILAVMVATDDHTRNAANLTANQEVEAQRVARSTFVTHKDGSVTPLDLKDAEMMVDTCTILRKKRFSDMTPGMLSVWEDCQRNGIANR